MCQNRAVVTALTVSRRMVVSFLTVVNNLAAPERHRRFEKATLGWMWFLRHHHSPMVPGHALWHEGQSLKSDRSGSN